MNTITQQKNVFVAEFLKVKSTPVYFLLFGACIFVGLIGFAAHYLDVHNAVDIGRSPWERLFKGATAIYSVFMLCPLTILLVSSLIYTEQRASAWKYMYTTPNRRATFYFNKLFVILIFIVMTVFILFGCVYLTGILLNYIFPEYEFSYYAVPTYKWFSKISHSFISLLGVIGVQYFLCITFKHFMVPLGIGLLGFVTGFILLTTNQKIGIYNPYDFPMIVKDFGMVNYAHREDVLNGLMNNVELHSIIYFIVFVLLGFTLENKKNIHS